MRRFLPTQDSIKGNRLLRWLGPRLHEPGLWHLNRRAVARGVAIGVFFGFMIPVAQIPAAAIGAFLARANLWVSAIATLVSNPFTYAPIYYAAYRLGGFLLGVIEALVGLWHAELREISIFILIIVVLVVRPQGLLGQRIVEKV